jgi:hypothetical protein
MLFFARRYSMHKIAKGKEMMITKVEIGLCSSTRSSTPTLG